MDRYVQVAIIQQQAVNFSHFGQCAKECYLRLYWFAIFACYLQRVKTWPRSIAVWQTWVKLSIGGRSHIGSRTWNWKSSMKALTAPTPRHPAKTSKCAFCCCGIQIVPSTYWLVALCTFVWSYWWHETFRRTQTQAPFSWKVTGDFWKFISSRDQHLGVQQPTWRCSLGSFNRGADTVTDPDLAT